MRKPLNTADYGRLFDVYMMFTGCTGGCDAMRKSAMRFTALAEYDEQLVRRLIEKATIYEDKFTVEFKSGVTVDIEGQG